MSFRGIPPRDLLQEIAGALYEKRIDVDEFFRRSCSVTNEWEYDAARPAVVNRIQQRRFTERSVPLAFRTLEDRTVTCCFPYLFRGFACWAA